MVASPLSASFKLFPSSARMERLISSNLTMQKYGNVIDGRFAVLLSKLVAVSIRWTVRVKIKTLHDTHRTSNLLFQCRRAFHSFIFHVVGSE